MTQTSILIVEDERIVAADLASRLKRMGYPVAGIAAESSQALDMVRRLQPGLVLMDIHLKGDRDGIQTAQAIHAQHDLPVIYLTAHSDPATFTRAKHTGPVGYIIKPYDERDLAVQIELALSKHALDRRLRESEERYRSLFENNHAVMMLIDPQNGHIMDANPAACTYYGYPPMQMLSLRIADINPLPAEEIQQQMQSALSRKVRLFYFKHRLADGSLRDVEIYSGPIVVDGKQLLYSIVHDITGRRQAEAALQRMNETLEQQVIERSRVAEMRAAHIHALAVELIRAEERERQRIAQLLHDDLQQIIAAAKLQLEVAGETLPANPLLDKVHQWLVEAAGKTRNLSHELGASALKSSSLADGLKRVAKTMQDQFGLAVRLDIPPMRSFDNKLVKVFVLRGVRELLFNIVKHAGVKEARVRVTATEDRLEVVVSDRGAGFDPGILEGVDAVSGMGLMHLRQRAGYIMGALRIDSAPGKGSRFHLSVPFDTADTDEPPAVD